MKPEIRVLASRTCVLALGLALTVGGGCGDDTVPTITADGGPDLARPREAGADGAPVPLQLPAGGAGHANVSESLGSGQVRAGRVTAASQLLSGIKVLGRVGDFKLYNSKVAFIIEEVGPSDGYAPHAAELLDAARLGKPGPKGASFFGEMMLGVGTRLLKPTSVGVVSDGSDGKPALVRAIGTPAPLPILAAMMGELGGSPDIYMVIDYQLAADSEALDLKLRLFNRSHSKLELPLIAVGFSSGDGVEFFADGVGFDVEKTGSTSWVAMVGEHVGYAFVSPDRSLDSIIRYEGIWANANGPLSVPAAGEAARRYRLILTDGDPEAVRRAARVALAESEPPALSGIVRDAKGAAVAGARVHVETDATPRAYVTMARSDAEGRYSVGLKPGKYLATVVADGRTSAGATAVQLGAAAATQDLTVAGTSTLLYTVKDAAGAALPAKLVIKPAAGGSFKSWPASHGERGFPGGALIVFAASGAGEVKLPPGDYAVTAARGFEYEIDKQSVTLADGESKALSFKLARSVDTAGFMCGDFHLHAMWSPDSSDLYELKVSALAAEGLEIPVITEHEYIADLNPMINQLGLEPWLRGVIGEELTTFVYGHFNPFPLTRDASKPNQGAMTWFKKSPTQLFDDVHKAWPGAVLQVNHPRSNAMGGYFTYVGWDPTTGVAAKASEWSKSFEALEVWNNNHWTADNKTVLDWYSFLDRGFLVTATGNSDSHHAYSTEVGYPRNYVKLSTDTPAKLDLAELARSVKEGRVLVSGGPFVTVAAGAKGMGDVVDASAKKVKLAVKVQAPTWMQVDTLRLVMNGAEAQKLTLDSKTADPTNPVIRFSGELELLPEKDAWVIVVVTGPGTLDPVSRNDTPFAVTNPIYLDVNGNGVYDPPKSF